MASMSTRGVWFEMLCCMWDAPQRGKIEGTHEQLARLLGCSTLELTSAISEINVTKIGDVTECNGIVTVINRRMYREQKEKESGALRVKRHREKNQCNGESNEDVTLHSSSSSSSSCTKVHLEESSYDDSSCPEPPIPEDIFITIPLNDKSEYMVLLPMIEEWRNLYPKVDIEQALRNIRGWNLSHPKERKTRQGILKHITGWLAREQDKGGNNGNGSRKHDFGSGASQAPGTAGLARSDSKPYPVDHEM